MEKVLEVRRAMCCLRCNRNYNAICKMYLTEKCDHHVCLDCYRGRPNTCVICDSSTRYKEMPFIEEAADALDQCTNMLNESKTDNKAKNIFEKLKRQNGQWKEQKECIDCGLPENIQKMYLCEKCDWEEPKTSDAVKKRAICPDCTIKYHIRKGHQTVDFAPRLNALLLTEHKTQIVTKTGKLGEMKEFTNVRASQYDIVSKNVIENIDKMTDVARKSESSKCQIEIFGKIGSVIDESKASTTRMNAELEYNLKNLQNDLTMIQNLFAARKNECEGDSGVSAKKRRRR